jgi:hypothetical protein
MTLLTSRQAINIEARMILFSFPREQRHFEKTCRMPRSSSSIPVTSR